jgi:hypothetical protein
MKMLSLVPADEVIRVLNLIPPKPASYVRFVEDYWRASYPEASSDAIAQFAAILGEWQAAEAHSRSPAFTRNYLLRAPFFRPPAATPEHGWRLPGTVSRRRSRFIADALISAHLRSLVDGWLDTGRQREGSEWPTRRNIHQAREAWQAVSEFLEQCPPQLMLSADSGVEFVIAAPDWRRPWAEDFFQAQQIEARRLLVGILASEWRDGLCKCRYPPCGRYFVRPKLRQQYRHGTFCSAAHRQQASAEALTKRRRYEATRYLIEATARWLCQQNVSEWQANIQLKNRLLALLAKEVRRKPNLRPGRQPVEMNWITRNRLAIEKRRLELLGALKEPSLIQK